MFSVNGATLSVRAVHSLASLNVPEKFRSLVPSPLVSRVLAVQLPVCESVQDSLEVRLLIEPLANLPSSALVTRLRTMDSPQASPPKAAAKHVARVKDVPHAK
jgi:hypothetical protein